jgi:homoserine dehydrogenase
MCWTRFVTLRADLALVGFGNVGRRFATLLAERADRLLADEHLACRVVGIATRRHGSAWDANGIDAPRAALAVEGGGRLDGDLSADPSGEIIDRLRGSPAALRVVIETTTLDIRAGQPAIDHVRRALAGGCHVVTANKGPAAFAYDELSRQAAAAGLSFLFEGAVMDGVPIFNLVRETLPAVDILGFRGVVNATTNHILTALEDGEAFGPALARMQAEGIAEADPSLDVEGWDAAAKAAALANVLMGAAMTPHGVRRTGIGDGLAAEARRAKSAGRRLRLVASAARRADGSVDAVVAPTELAGDDLLAGLRGQANALVLKTDLLGEVAICQLEGSLTQTAYALVSDLVTIARRHRAPHGGPPRRIPSPPAR